MTTHASRFWVLLVCLWGGAACPAAPQAPVDASGDRRVAHLDGQPSGEGGPSSVVNFVAQGCASEVDGQCIGAVPLTVTFLAMVPEKPLSASWSFGDDSAVESGLVVTHTYLEPGVYDVSLTVGGNTGTTSELKPDFVVVEQTGPGGGCRDDGHCSSGTCVCETEEEGCPYPLSEGLCLEQCEQYCPQQPYPTVCVDLTHKGDTPAAAWRTRLCLRSCTTNLDCSRPGFSCRLAPGTAGWLRVCLPPFPRFVGAPCRSPDGAVDPSLCLGGLCLDIGASGYCTGGCTAGSCPEGTGCAAFNGSAVTSPVCLLRCTSANCASDPLLHCELSGGTGDFGFQTLAPVAPDAYFCSVRRCSSDLDCGAVGWCNIQSGGFCALP